MIRSKSESISKKARGRINVKFRGAQGAQGGRDGRGGRGRNVGSKFPPKRS